MTSPLQKRILEALVVAMKPLARALLASGITFKQFEEVSKCAFVAVAASDYGIRGRPTNNSRIAVITGLGRKEVKRLRDQESGQWPSEFITESPASILLHNWNNDPDYQDENGEPLILHYDSGYPSFVSLVAKYAGDIPPGAMKTELNRVSAIEELDDDRIKVKTPYFVPPGLGDRLIIGLEEGASTLLSTLAYNCDPKRVEEPRFQRVASVDGIHSDFHGEIEEYAKEHLTTIGLDFCTYLDAYHRKSLVKSGEDQEVSQVGIGLYYYKLRETN